MDTSDIPSIGLIRIRESLITDMDLIYSTWLRPLYYDNDEISEINRNSFMRAMNKRIKYLLDRPSVKVKIACLDDAPDVILGYSVIEWRKLWWIYVKKAWREMGIAKKLVPSHINSCAYLTRLGKTLKPDAWDVDPYLKEEVE